ncbi:MAG: thrombospondin type 3 repeat-containing protein [Bacteroidota bacterium]
MRFFIFAFISCVVSISLTAQNCDQFFTFDTQQDVDDFVANFSTCTTVTGVIVDESLDYSAMTFLDSVTNLTIRESQGLDVLGLHNIQGVGSLVMSSNNFITNLNLLNFQTVSNTLNCNGVDLEECQFLGNLNNVNSISLGIMTNLEAIVSFTNLQEVGFLGLTQFPNGIPTFPSLEIVEHLFISTSSTSNDFSEFSQLDSVTTLMDISASTNTQTLSGLTNILHIERLRVGGGSSLTNVDLSSAQTTPKIEIYSPNITSVSLPQVPISEFLCRNTAITDFSFFSTQTEIEVLTIWNSPASELTTLNGIIVSDRFNLLESDFITSLNGINFNDSISVINISSNSILNDIEPLDDLQTITNSLSILNNPKLKHCCVLQSILDPSNAPPSVSLSNNSLFCNGATLIDYGCSDADSDGVLNNEDNCLETSNMDQQDSDGDGEGDVCDVCPTPISVEITSQADVDNFFTTFDTTNCKIQNLSIEVGDDLYDLSPLFGIRSIMGDLYIAESSNLQSLDGLESLEHIGGEMILFVLESLVDISALSNLKTIGSDMTIEGAEILRSLDGLENLESIGGDIDIISNGQLSYCCVIAPFVNGELNFSGSISINNNKEGCANTTDIQDACADDDGDGVINQIDNCSTIPNQRQDDQDMDGIGDVCDNCPNKFNPKQGNQDNDQLGDACDLCPLTGGGFQSNQDLNNNGIGDACETGAGAESAFVGIGSKVPKAKLEVASGDVYLSNVYRGVILQSPDGSCFRLRIQNDGSMSSVAIDCPD